MKKYRFSDGVIITASTVEEAKAQHKVMAAQEFGVLDADKRSSGPSQAESAKSSRLYVIQRKDGKFVSTTTTLKYGHDDVKFVKDINKADIFLHNSRAKGIMDFIKKYNPTFELTVKKLVLYVE